MFFYLMLRARNAKFVESFLVLSKSLVYILYLSTRYSRHRKIFFKKKCFYSFLVGNLYREIVPLILSCSLQSKIKVLIFRFFIVILGDLKFSHNMWNCLKCLCRFSFDNPLNFGWVFNMSDLSSHSSLGYSILLGMTILLEVVNYLIVL